MHLEKVVETDLRLVLLDVCALHVVRNWGPCILFQVNNSAVLSNTIQRCGIFHVLETKFLIKRT